MPSNMKYTIAKAYTDLLLKKDVDKVTVKDVVTACGITRQTFYYHFQDLLDVLEWTMDRKCEEALKEGLSAKTPEDTILVFLQKVADNRLLAQRLLNSRKHAQLGKLLVPHIRTWLEQIAREKGSAEGREACIHDISLRDMEFALQFYSYAIVGIFLEICMDENVDLRQTSAQIVKLVRGPFTE